MQAALNYEENLSGQPAIAQRADYTLAQHIMQTEREAVLCHSLHRAASSRAEGQAFRQPLVVGVIGEAHLEGVAELWESGKWQGVLDDVQRGEDLCRSPAPLSSSDGKLEPLSMNSSVLQQLSNLLPMAVYISLCIPPEDVPDQCTAHIGTYQGRNGNPALQVVPMIVRGLPETATVRQQVYDMLS